MCFICGTSDGVVRTDYVENFHKMSQREDNEMHWIEKSDHTDIVFNADYSSQAIRRAICFMDRVTEELVQERLDGAVGQMN